MSSEEVRCLSGQDLQMVQNLIEGCIQLHMSRTDAVNMLLGEAKIEPGITELVWQRLEEENREFFEIYHIRLALKEQIVLFNELLKKQAALMEHIQNTGAASMPSSNGCRVAQFQANAGCYHIDRTGPCMRPENLQPTIVPSFPFTNGASTLQTPTAFDFVSNPLHAQSSDSLRLMQGLNGGNIKREGGDPSESQIIYEAGRNAVETHAPSENASVGTFSHLGASSQPLDEALVAIETSSFGQLGLGQIPKNFSFPDLSAYPNLLDSYPTSVFATTDTDNFLDFQDKGQLAEENNKFEAISDNYSNGEFGRS